MYRILVNLEWPYPLYVSEPKTGVSHEEDPGRESAFVNANLRVCGQVFDCFDRVEIHDWDLLRFHGRIENCR